MVQVTERLPFSSRKAALAAGLVFLAFLMVVATAAPFPALAMAMEMTAEGAKTPPWPISHTTLENFLQSGVPIAPLQMIYQIVLGLLLSLYSAGIGTLGTQGSMP